MRFPRRFIKEGAGTRHYHAMSRIVNREFIFGEEEKEYFRKTMRDLEVFSGVHVLTYCIMSNHFHLLLQVPKPEPIDDDELFRRMRAIYSKITVANFKKELGNAREKSNDVEVNQLRKRFICRMYDLSMFLKDLKQKFTQWHNRRVNRRGTLWEERFRSLLVEGSQHALLTMASYIDLNPVRAGICKDPKDYRYSGYGEAIGGKQVAREGLKTLVQAYGGKTDWRCVQKDYRVHLYEVGGSKGLKVDGTPLNAGFSREQVLDVLDKKGELTQSQLIRCRVRYFTDGVVLGSRSYVNEFFEEKREYFGARRKTGARKIKGCQWGGLWTARDLQIDPIS